MDFCELQWSSLTDMELRRRWQGKTWWTFFFFSQEVISRINQPTRLIRGCVKRESNRQGKSHG